MAKRKNGKGDQLSGHIAAFQGRLRKLSKAATLKDFAVQFAGVVKEVLPSTDVDLFYQAPGAGQWDLMARTGPGAGDRLPLLPRKHPTATSAVRETSNTLSMVQELVDDSTIGIVVRKPPGKKYSEVERLSLRLFVYLFDNAYHDLLSRRHEKDLIFSLNHRVLQLNSLIGTGIEVAKLDQESSPHQMALERAASLTNASKGVVRLQQGKSIKEQITFPSGVSIQRGAQNKISAKFTFGQNTYTFELFEKESRNGFVQFEETDQLLLDALARQVHASLENRYLHEQALEKQRIEQEMSVAASIQQRIIPKSLPKIPGYDIAGINIPSKSVGGDYYDCIPLRDGTFALIIADVAGKGMPAALLVSSLHAYLSAYLETSISLPDLAKRLNTVIGHASTADKFITAIIALVSPGKGEIESLNAGHNPAYLLRSDNSSQQLTAGGLPFGMLDTELPYESECVSVTQGDSLLLYTDGITEATNEKNELYEDCLSLKDFLQNHKTSRADEFISDLIAGIRRFTGSAPQSDDITALYLHRTQ